MFATPTVHKDLHVTHGDDNECWVEFYKQPVKMELESEQQGRPIFRDFDYITIQFPGDKTKKVVRPVKDEDKIRFGRHWKAFTETGVVPLEGTPLDEWPALTRSQALELKSMNVHTVEQLASIGDHALSFLGAREYREQAQKYIEKASGIDARVTALQADNDKMAEQYQAMSDQYAELAKNHMELMRYVEEQKSKVPETPTEGGVKVRKTRGPNKPKQVTAPV